MAEENGFNKEEALFLSIMYSFHAAAMHQMGKVANPFTGKIERDMDAARSTIDVLQMFQTKTAGNLTDREERVLKNLVTELQLNFVDEAGRTQEPTADEAEATPDAPSAPPDDSAAAPEETPAPDEAEAAGEGEGEKAAAEEPPAEYKKKE
ncbi:MAG: DUF1844 domain-containing protein [Candidatus Zixiibacteriota bacterium]|jgi:hypothetical protein